MVAEKWLVCCPELPSAWHRERAQQHLPCSSCIWCITFQAVSVPRLLLPGTELNVGQGYFLRSFVLAAGSPLGTGVQSSTGLSCSLGRVLFGTIPFPHFRVQDLIPRCCAGTRLPSVVAETSSVDAQTPMPGPVPAAGGTLACVFLSLLPAKLDPFG